jgi:hypothetical protein
MSEVYSVVRFIRALPGLPTGTVEAVTRDEGYRLVRSEDRLDVALYFMGAPCGRVPWAAVVYALDYVEEPKTQPTGGGKAGGR